eukprot:CAMPEP_0206193782 /NCGR_PEP_ID=MMETSP0166-20121206/6783_1 /ASSEMBLY_ACC=CAM_ASM_000260 /TAXON_ID=95228 /ORGANISM="Vannella robusta, Strain DIVA3 518/3/11/1/6" /LENGTH=547 /DNA_ID=CAMNT_0053610583 /DNA_START=92 /DNA_END=1732 /DNA_ORIENTATION=+
MNRTVIINAHGKLLSRFLDHMPDEVPITVIFPNDDEQNIGDMESIGAETVYQNANFNNIKKLTEMFAGAQTLFLTLDYNIKYELKQYQNIVDAAELAGMVNVVFFSAFGFLKDSSEYFQRHKSVEKYIKEKGCFSYTWIRPSLTFQELLRWNLDRPTNDDGTVGIHFPLPEDQKVAFIDSAGISDCVVEILRNPGEHSRLEYILTGRESLSVRDVLDIVEEVFDKKFSYTQTNDKEDWVKAGYSKDWACPFSDVIAGDLQMLEIVSDDVETITGNVPTTCKSLVETLKLAQLRKKEDPVPQDIDDKVQQFEKQVEKLSKQIQEVTIDAHTTLQTVTDSKSSSDSENIQQKQDAIENMNATMKVFSKTLDELSGNVSAAVEGFHKGVNELSDEPHADTEDRQSSQEESKPETSDKEEQEEEGEEELSLSLSSDEDAEEIDSSELSQKSTFVVDANLNPELNNKWDNDHEKLHDALFAREAQSGGASYRKQTEDVFKQLNDKPLVPNTTFKEFKSKDDSSEQVIPIKVDNYEGPEGKTDMGIPTVRPTW